ncbi:MAG: hypothetical protein GX774_11350 [Armatimonadetes bacterium]|jgi:hypothetical protein|nr:hypothetical protein [Armatimonadota bacterium]
MEQTRFRAVVVAAILLAGGVWVAASRPERQQAATPERAPAPAAVGDVADEDEPIKSVAAPWANKATDATPLVKHIKTHPSPAGKQILAAFDADKAVVVVSIPPKPDDGSALSGWLTKCGDYCKGLAEIVRVDPKDPGEAELLRFLEMDKADTPFLVSIALSGEVRKRLSGEISSKQVVELFAEVTGSCSVDCEDGC